MKGFKTIDDIEVSDKRILLRADLNVPIINGKIADFTRIKRVSQTINQLLNRGAKVIVMSHFGRPEGSFNRDYSLAPIADGLSVATGREVKFAVDCIGIEAQKAAKSLCEGEMLLLENLRFHPQEEENEQAFAKQLASIADIYVNDAFSCSHRAHASIVGVTNYLPAVAGLLMQEELNNLENILTNPQKPVAAIIGGSKISTKLALLETLISKVNVMIIGGGMANTFLKAQGKNIGNSIYESNLLQTANNIIQSATKKGCKIVLPTDCVVVKEFKTQAESKVLDIDKITEGMILDIGPNTVETAAQALKGIKTIIWNGPMGAFEYSPFDVGTISLARVVAKLSASDGVKSISGGGDTVSALSHAALTGSFTYISTAGGAFLEWLEGKTLPGIAALYCSS